MVALLIVGGALLELAGIALVALDVRDARAQADTLSRQDQRVEVQPAISTATAMPATVLGGGTAPTPTLEERVTAAEQNIAKLERDLEQAAERETQAHRQLTDRIAGWVGEARRETWELRQELRPIIGRVAAGNIRRRAFGAFLFALGIVAQTAGNLVAL